MKCHEPGPLADRDVQSSDVRKADEDLRILSYEIEVERWQQSWAASAAANAPDGLYIFVRKRCVKIGETLGICSRKKTLSAASMSSGLREKSKRRKARQRAIERFRFDTACRRNNGDLIACFQRLWFDHPWLGATPA